MKISRLNQGYRASTSTLHRKVGDTLRESPIFAAYRIYQEYPVNRLVPSYPFGSHKFDWVILDLHLVIECHGEQHYRPVNFGGIPNEQAIENFQNQRFRDFKKRQAVEDAGYTYIVVPYTDLKKVDDTYLWELYIKNRNTSPLETKQKPKPISEYQEAQKERAREYRRNRYKQQKELRDKLRRCRDEDQEH